MENNYSYDELSLRDFDLLGMINLKDVKGIEELVTPIGNGEYVSRGKAYSLHLTCEEASRFREELKEILAEYPRGKKAFVVLDHMANLSGKVYYEEIQRAINNKDFSGIYQAKACLLEDVSNIIALLENKPLNVTNLVLPESKEFIAKRIIECNNMALLYIFTKSFNLPEGYKMLNTGLGGIFIGPFFKTVYGLDWTNLLKSKYVDESNQNSVYNLMNNIVDPNLFEDGKVLLIDDNIGTGDTTREIATEFKILGYDFMYGAVQYNWINFYRVGTGEKDIHRFNPSEIDYITQFNYPGHKLIKHAYEILCGERDLQGNNPSMDNSSPYGLLYEKYKKSKTYDSNDYSNIIALQSQGLKYCEMSGIKISDVFNANTNPRRNKIFKPTTYELISKIDKYNANIFESPNNANKYEGESMQ